MFLKFSFCGHTHNIWKFLGQRSNESHSCDLRHSCGNVGSLTYLPQWKLLFFLRKYPENLILSLFLRCKDRVDSMHTWCTQGKGQHDSLFDYNVLTCKECLHYIVDNQNLLLYQLRKSEEFRKNKEFKAF